MTISKETVKCHLCDKVIDGLFNEPSDDAAEILYYCDACSEMTIEVPCSNCGDLFQVMPEKDEAGDEDVEIEYLCDHCVKKNFRIIDLNNFEFDPKAIGIQCQKDILSNRRDQSKWHDALGMIGSLASQGNLAAIDYAGELLESSYLDIDNKRWLIEWLNGNLDQKIKNALLDILRVTKSDNKTRNLIKLILKTLAYTRDSALIEPLDEIAARFSVRMRNHVENAIEHLYRHKPVG